MFVVVLRDVTGTAWLSVFGWPDRYGSLLLYVLNVLELDWVCVGTFVCGPCDLLSACHGLPLVNVFGSLGGSGMRMHVDGCCFDLPYRSWRSRLLLILRASGMLRWLESYALRWLLRCAPVGQACSRFSRIISRVGLVVLCHALETSLLFDLVLDATIHSTGRHLAIPNVSPVPAVRPYNSCECSCVSSLQLTLPSFGFSVRSYNLLCVLILCVEMPVAMFPGLRTNGSCCLCCSGWVPCLWYLVVLALKVLAVWGCLLVLRSLVRTLVVCLVSVLCPLSFGFC